MKILRTTWRQVRCPKCDSSRVEAAKVHDPETRSMNSNATLKCSDCEHEWEGRVTSEHHKMLRRTGRAI